VNLCDNSIDWCTAVKYLVYNYTSGKALKFDINSTKRAFCADYDSIFMYGSRIDEIARPI